MAPLAFFRSFFRGFRPATPKRFEIIVRDLLPNLSLDITEVHEKKNPKSDVARRRYAPPKFAGRRFLPPRAFFHSKDYNYNLFASQKDHNY